MSELTRRNFLAATAVILQSTLIGWPLAAQAEQVSLDVLSAEIGGRYLEMFPAENDIHELRRLLHFGDAHLMDRLRGDMHSNYGTANTFRFNQWILSRTEGRLCALRALDIGT